MRSCEVNDAAGSVAELQNDWFIACEALEIEEVPSCALFVQDGESVHETMFRRALAVLKEFSTLESPDSFMLELLLNAPCDAAGTVKLSILVRTMSNTKNLARQSADKIADILASRLEGMDYPNHRLQGQDFLRAFASIAAESAVGICKAESYDLGMQAMLPYYRCGICEPTATSPSEVLSLLMNTPGSAISMQVFPTCYTENEAMFIFQMADSLNRIVEGAFSGDMLHRDVSATKSRDYFQELREARDELCVVNILAMGPSASIHKVAAGLLGFLGLHGTCSFRHIRIPKGVVDPSSDECLYPWNALDYLMESARESNPLPFEDQGTCLRFPFLMPEKEAAAILPLPYGDEGLRGIRCKVFSQALEAMDESLFSSNSISMGELQGVGRILGFPVDDFARHAVAVGMPGSGKTTFSMGILLQIYRHGIPFLIVEPSKAEYRALVSAIPDLRVFTPGRSDIARFPFNPFLPPEGVTVETYVPSLYTAFQSAFSMESPLDVLFLKAIRQCYLIHGWRNDSSLGDARARPFGMVEFIAEFRRLIDTSDYSTEVKGNLKSGGAFRLASLLEQNRGTFDTDFSISIKGLLETPTVLELNAVDNPQQKALIMALVLGKVNAYVKANYSSGSTLHNVLMIDEAHVLLDPPSTGTGNGASAENTTATSISNMIAEMRAYGLGVIVADQTPSRIGKSIIANTDLKIAMRLVQEDERRLIGSSCAMSESGIDQLARLQPGQAFVHSRRLDSPKLVAMRDCRAEGRISLHCPDDILRESLMNRETRPELSRPFTLCTMSADCAGGCIESVRAEAEYLVDCVCADFASRITDKEQLAKHVLSLDDALLHYAVQSQVTQRLSNCAKIQLYRKTALDKGIRLDSRHEYRLFSNALKKDGDECDGKNGA